MIDTSKVTGYEPGAEHEHDEYHSSLEVDDTSGWRVFLVPGLLLLFLVAALALFLLSSDGDAGPDPRIAARLQQKQKADADLKAQIDARQNAAQQAAWQQQGGAAAAPAAGNAAGQ